MTKKPIRVMIVEDNEATAYLIKKAFSERGEKVDWDLCFAKDGEEALDCLFRRGHYAAASRPDFVLLDWNLPKVSGKEVLHLLKSDEDLRTIPVLVFSGSQADEDVHAAYDGHANGYILKPGEMDALCAVIDSIESFWVHTAHHPRKRPRGYVAFLLFRTTVVMEERIPKTPALPSKGTSPHTIAKTHLVPNCGTRARPHVLHILPAPARNQRPNTSPGPTMSRIRLSCPSTPVSRSNLSPAWPHQKAYPRIHLYYPYG